MPWWHSRHRRWLVPCHPHHLKSLLVYCGHFWSLTIVFIPFVRTLCLLRIPTNRLYRLPQSWVRLSGVKAAPTLAVHAINQISGGFWFCGFLEPKRGKGMASSRGKRRKSNVRRKSNAEGPWFFGFLELFDFWLSSSSSFQNVTVVSIAFQHIDFIGFLDCGCI